MYNFKINGTHLIIALSKCEALIVGVSSNCTFMIIALKIDACIFGTLLLMGINKSVPAECIL